MSKEHIMHGKSYIPAKEADFIEWSENLIAVSTASKTLWNLPEDKLAELQALHVEAKALYEKCLTASYTKVDMELKHEKTALLRHLEEVFVKNNLQNNDRMTDSGRAALRITIRDPHPTPRPKPSGIPEVEVETPHPRVVRIKFRDQNAARWSKPENVHGLECLWLVSDTPPALVEDLLHSAASTRSPLEFSFEENERGKRLYFAVRWENGPEKKGDWSEIFSAVIP
jgi:hypothetical protein